MEISADRRYFVLFTLDKSGSMNEHGRWRKVVGAVNGFLDKLVPADIFGVMTFNDKAEFLTGS